LPSCLLEHPAPSGTYPLSLHDALPIFAPLQGGADDLGGELGPLGGEQQCLRPRCHVLAVQEDLADLLADLGAARLADHPDHATRSEEHTSELQSRENLVCRLLLEKKKK